MSADPYNILKEERAMHASVDKNRFASMYSGQPPWEIGKPQPGFTAVADQITGSILDAGCGTGEHSLFFTDKGCTVTGIDFLEEAIQRAKRKAAERGSTVKFLVKDATDLKGWSERFDNVIDSGLFHGFSDEDRKKYVAGLATVLKPGGRLFLMCFSEEEPGTIGPRRLTQKELRDTFTVGWAIESIKPSQFEVVPLKDFTFSVGGPKAWFAVVRRE
jgi:SAM-dependent methyltransferase